MTYCAACGFPVEDKSMCEVCEYAMEKTQLSLPLNVLDWSVFEEPETWYIANKRSYDEI